MLKIVSIWRYSYDNDYSSRNCVAKERVYTTWYKNWPFRQLITIFAYTSLQATGLLSGEEVKCRDPS